MRKIIGVSAVMAALFVSPASAMVGDADHIAPLALPDRLDLGVGGQLGPLAEKPSPKSGATIPGRYIVVLKDSVAGPAKVARAQVRERGGELGLLYRHALKGYSATLSKDDVAALERDPRVKYVTPDRIFTVASQKTPTGIERSYAAANPSLVIDATENLKVFADVAVIDTGIDHEHPDLNVIERTNCVPAGEDPEDPEEEDIEECVDDSGSDGSGHGTHVAGTVGALDNGSGVVGVAPGARLWAVRVMNSGGSGSMSWIIAGVDWVTAHAEQIEVANMSLGCACESPALDEAIEASVDAGVVYAVAAGNDEADSKDFSPASNPDAITVSALADYDGAAGGTAYYGSCGYGGLDDDLAVFSNYGEGVDVAAPGVCVYSTLPGGKYGWSSGTSMASPHVAGAAAVLASKENPEDLEDVEAIRDSIVESGNSAWTDTSPDEIQEPLLDLSDYQLFNANDQDAVTLPATVASPSKATLRGSVHSAGWSSFRYYFEYGKTVGYGTTVPAPPGDLVEPEADFTEVSKAIEGLQGSTVYHYRVVAVHNSSYFYGPDRVFATTPPVATTETASDVQANDATLNATIDPEGLETSYYFEFYLNDSNSVRSPASPVSAGSGTEATEVSQAIGALTGSKTYHYRIVASNAAGTVYGEEESFTTDVSQWTAQSSPDFGGGDESYLGYLSCVSSRECMAVGRSDGSLKAARWDGEGWDYSTPPAQKGADHAYLEGVSCASGDSCIAVGVDAIDDPYEWRLFTESWDGTKWALEAISAPEGALFPALRDVSCVAPDECIAVGQYWLENGEGRALAYRWDGEEWTSLPSPETSEPEFHAVSCVSSSWCMAVGLHWLANGEIGPLAEVWDGEDWTAVQTTSPQGASLLTLGGVSCPATDSCMVLGQSEPSEGAGTAEHWDGLEWTAEALPTPVAAESAHALRLSCAEEESCTAVGYYTTTDRIMPLAMSWDGEAWALQSTTDQTQEEEALGFGAVAYSVDCTSVSHCLAVGERGGGSAPLSPLVERYRAPGPVLETEPATDVTRFGAELQATINPAGAETEYQFEYGTSKAYGSKAPASPESVGEGSEDVAVDQWIEGLKPDTTYHFRVVATNADGTTYGVDRTFTTKVAAKPIFTSSFGKAGSANGDLDEPLGLDVDSEGNIWVADTENDRIEKFDSTGKFLLASGSSGTGNGKFDMPYDVAVDSAGNAWVTDAFNNRVQKFNSTGKYVSQFGTKGSGNGQLFLPWGIDIDAEGKIWVADKGNERIERFNSKGEYVSQFATYGPSAGVAADSEGNVWATEPADNRIRKFDSEGKALVTVGSEESGDFALPHGLTVDADDNVWVADTSNHRVRAFESDGRYLTQFGTNGSGEGQFSYPGDLAFDPEGDVWVLDSGNSRVQKWSFGAPVAVTEDAADVTGTEMTLHATVNPEGSETEYQFEYGKTTAYGSSVPVSPEGIGSDDKDVAVSEAIEGLLPGTTYHFRIAATNDVGTVYGEDLTATTEHEWYALSPPSFEHYESKLNGISCVSQSDCMAVGYYKSTSGGKKRTLSAHWDGEDWTLLTTPNENSEDNVLNAVSCSSASSCVAVGRYSLGFAGQYRLLAAHWDGEEWTTEFVAIMSKFDNDLRGVSCLSASACMGAGKGKKTSSGVDRTLAAQWSGGETWPLISTPNESEEDNALNGISCDSATDCMAVGYYKSSGKKRTLALHWDGEEWSVLSTPNENSEDNVLNAVSCSSASSCAAVGRYSLGFAGQYRLLAAHWDGEEWTTEFVPIMSKFDNDLRGIACETASTCVAVGKGKETSSGPDRTLALHWDSEAEEGEGAWQIESSPNENEKNNALNAVSCASGSCVAVGSYVTASGPEKMLFERY